MLSRRFHCAFTALTMHALHFHGAHNACTSLSRRSHCADDVLKTLVFAQQNEVFVSFMFVLENETMPTKGEGRRQGKKRL